MYNFNEITTNTPIPNTIALFLSYRYIPVRIGVSQFLV